MQSLTTLAKVFDNVDKMATNCYDKFIPVSGLSFNSLDSVNIGSDLYTLGPVAQQSISYRLGIPFQYLRRCPPEMQSYNMNHWIKREKNDELFFRFDGETVRAIFTPRYRPVDNFEILEKLDSLGYGPDTQAQASLDNGFMMLNIMESHRTFSLNGDGDKMTPGISICNSEIGLASLSISAFFLRLVCTNGLIAKTQVAAAFRHISIKILTEFPKILNQLQHELDRQKDKFKISLESRVENPGETLSRFNRQFQLNAQEVSSVEWAVLEAGSIESMWHVINIYTRAAQNPELPAQSSYKLQKVGGDILELVK